MIRKDEIIISSLIEQIFQTPENTGSWFGYYNYDTLNNDQTRMLSHRTKNDAKVIEKGMTVEVGYYDIPSGEWHKVGDSDSYSWQQGTMLQWLPGCGNENKIIYNTSDGNHNIAKIVDVNTKEEKVINWSIYGITPDGSTSITLVMERSHWCRAYHYESIANPHYEGKIYDEDGIYSINLGNNTRNKIISIQDIINIDKEPYFDDAKHWLEHIMISPNGRKFCFLHRFTIGELDDYETRLFISDIDGKNLQIVPGWRSFYWSHFGWDGDDAFVIYAYESDKHQIIYQKFKSSQKKDTTTKKNRTKKFTHLIPKVIRHFVWKLLFYKQKPQYYQYYTITDAGVVLNQNFNASILDIDGHPSFTKDGEYMITDSYPDKKGYQRLVIYNKRTNKGIIVAKLYAGLNRKPGSCDLHPKLCRDNNYLAVDSAFNGRHHMILFKLNWQKIKIMIG